MNEFDEIVRRLAAASGHEEASKLPQNDEERSLRWIPFVAIRSDNQRRLIELLSAADAKRMMLRSLAEATGLDGQQLAGTLGSLQKSSMTEFGEPLIEAKSWFTNEDGLWDREYVLNPRIIPAETVIPPRAS